MLAAFSPFSSEGRAIDGGGTGYVGRMTPCCHGIVGRAYFATEDCLLEGTPEPRRHHVVEDGVDGGADVEQNDGEMIEAPVVDLLDRLGPLLQVEEGQDAD